MHLPLIIALVMFALMPATAAAARANPFVVPSALGTNTNNNNSDETDSRNPSLAGSRLRGVILGTTPLANVDGTVLAPGDSHAGYRLLRVDSRSAVFELAGDVVVLQLDTGETP